MVVRLNRGTRIGTISGGYLCIPAGDLTWKGGRVIINDDELTTVFREELVKANYPVVGDPNALFEDASEWRAELLVAVWSPRCSSTSARRPATPPRAKQASQ